MPTPGPASVPAPGPAASGTPHPAWDRPGVVVITGIQAAGKSTVAQALAERLSRSVHLRGDTFRRMVVNGAVPMTPDADERALAQLRLRHRLTAVSADQYASEGFTVIAQDILLGEHLRELTGQIRTRPLAVVVLAPRPPVVAAREAARPKTAYGADWSVADLDRGLRESTPRIGLWLDTSEQTVAQTVEEILARAWTEGAVG
ncbi:AAA family ATPase [Streptomyces sp. MST-110588]|uniref:AAA family ATPase n=1 Tax=Streptomyces sp. MST-110588 TaxID=2833628 RepID=UPI001F5C2873|nr:AAA family ATPase [Streptomyces sp. MST-110588]UNO38834.1 AAA family ATPase [Streptomyces sp. MST-110588]